MGVNEEGLLGTREQRLVEVDDDVGRDDADDYDGEGASGIFVAKRDHALPRSEVILTLAIARSQTAGWLDVCGSCVGLTVSGPCGRVDASR